MDDISCDGIEINHPIFKYMKKKNYGPAEYKKLYSKHLLISFYADPLHLKGTFHLSMEADPSYI